MFYGIKRPISIDDETWEKYQGEVTTNLILLEKQGWAVDGIKAYAKYINKNIAGKIPSGNVLVEIDKCNKQTQLVGSEVFKKMWYAWKAEGLSTSESKKKLNMLMKVTGMDGIDENSSAEELRRIANKIDPNLEPDDKFWGSLSSTVRTAFLPTPEGNPIALANIEKRIHIENALKGKLGKQVHLFRYVISYQQAEYISNLYAEGTDEEKLTRYIREHNVDWSVDESARLHQKRYYDKDVNRYIFPEGHSNANGGVNLKVVTNGKFRSEFIINGDGKFLTLLDKDATQDAMVNCSSFNYATANDNYHQMFDVFPAKETGYEPRFRDESLFLKDKNGITYKERRYIAPEILNSDDSTSLKQNRKNFKDRVKL
ncbi:DUF3114 domain-containing protein [Mogibacterium diversum]|uniref:DUF3114 domain-containing protein n=1 Tax=Mogibacterium diversum TaxID=114527 RepID=UPI0028E9F828|nr:DUF3114 domain-containing protein [Mogibacterium diversum]